MTNTILVTVLLISYVVMFIILIKGANPLITLFGMGVLWAALGGYNLKSIIEKLIGGTIISNATALLTVLFGAWFAQVLLQTGIVKQIIRSTVELGGDKPKLVVAIIMVVVSILFTSLYSIGPVIAVGVIVLPIMISMGVKPRIAATAYTLSVGVATLLNPTQYQVLRGMFSYVKIPEVMSFPWIPYAFVAFGAGILVNVLGVVLTMKFSAPTKAWAMPAKMQDSSSEQRVPFYACLAPLLPVILIMAFKMNIFVAFIIGSLYAVFTARNKEIKPMNLFSKAFSDGFSDSAGMVMYLTCTFILVASAKPIAPIFAKVLGSIFPSTTLALILLCAIGVPLTIYRGPLAPGGVGAAFFMTLIATGLIPANFVWMVGFIMSSINYSLDPSASDSVWTMSYTKIKPAEYIKTILPISWVYGAVVLVICFLMHRAMV